MIKGRRARYAPEHVPELTLLPTSEDALFEEVVTRLLGPRA